MGISRDSIIKGPGVVTFDSAVIFAKGDIDNPETMETVEHESSAHGRVLETIKERVTSVSFDPVGDWSQIATIMPYRAFVPGQSIFTNTDKPLVITSRNGETRTYPAAAITKLPSVLLSSVKTMLGPIEFRTIGTEASDWSATGSSVTDVDSGVTFPISTFASTNIPVMRYIGALGSVSGWTSIETTDGWTLDFELSTEDVFTDGQGLVDIIFKEIKVMARCTPIGKTAAQVNALLGWQGTGTVASRGKSLALNANNLVISGQDGTGSPMVTINKVAAKSAGYKFGSTTLRLGEIGFVGTSSFTSGVKDPIYTFGTTS